LFNDISGSLKIHLPALFKDPFLERFVVEFNACAENKNNFNALSYQ